MSLDQSRGEDIRLDWLAGNTTVRRPGDLLSHLRPTVTVPPRSVTLSTPTGHAIGCWYKIQLTEVPVSKHHLCSHADRKHSIPFLTLELDGIPPSIAVKMCFKFRPLYSERDQRTSFKRAWRALWVGLDCWRKSNSGLEHRQWRS